MAFASLGTAFILNAALFVTDRPAAQQASFVAPQSAETTDITTQPGTFSLRIRKDANRVKLRGQTPSEEDHKTVLGLVKANFASIDIADRMKAGSSSNANIKVGGLSFALRVLSYLETGTASIEDGVVTLEGTASTRALYDEALKYINHERPTGVTVTHNISAPPKSLTWRAEVGDKRLDITGAITPETGGKELEDNTRTLFNDFKIANRTTPAEDTPENWMKAVRYSLEVAHHLDSGVVQITDGTIKVNGKTTNETKLKAIDELDEKRPRGFALDIQVNTADTKSETGLLGIPSANAAER